VGGGAGGRKEEEGRRRRGGGGEVGKEGRKGRIGLSSLTLTYERRLISHILIRADSSSGRGAASGNWMPRHGYQVTWDRNETSVLVPCAGRYTEQGQLQCVD